ncbi:uncharacterized protein LOC117582990 [Drosophila guanche]|uniref:Blast:Vacuolar ATPase assembly integral membrane protein VMA21 homolog n=1 Tax=Drosophila guanche TaxID=7266 RepID=A0A3B0JCL6_DROGU|nr:uncharacterized protein LOC117582990 [Drosophila guanche]SPP80117.1 blast:Vacuolar ATPase assembly integral membrane protein VMA21 homolog [Drosophila guanche]
MLARPSKLFPGTPQDLPSLEEATAIEKCHAEVPLNGLQQPIYFLLVFMLCPVLIFCGFKYGILGSSDLNVDIGSGVATVIVVHILIAVYIFRLIFQQEFSRMEKIETLSEWEIILPQQAQTQHPVLVVLLLMFYCSLIIGFPVATFFALKFVVLKNLFLIANMETDIISAIGAVIAVHITVGLFIYRV